MATYNDHETHDVVSRHMTSEGVLVYVRTADGRLQARLHRWAGGDAIVVRGDRTPARCA